MKDKHKFSEDYKFVQAAQQNRSAFGYLYEKYFEKLYRYIFVKIGEKQTANDLCQAVMLKAMLNLHKYEDRGYPFSSWLYKIAGNEVNLYFRKLKKMQEVSLSPANLTALMLEVKIENPGAKSTQEVVIDLMNELETAQAEMIELRFFLGFSFKEMAHYYQVSEANVKMKLYRLLKKVRRLYGAKNEKI
ncbi:RNA polymerase sigma factor [Putridiphycobacter roseus]|uniref:RNA polymerase sigma factor n=1 Tax=Putridiphycobacter roseus TaxID=2219161 RepID=UPI001313D835|nr:sigma-70 family RNA polymerase sigma factor [Putridiphycobacter roseus]